MRFPNASPFPTEGLHMPDDDPRLDGETYWAGWTDAELTEFDALLQKAAWRVKHDDVLAPTWQSMKDELVRRGVENDA